MTVADMLRLTVGVALLFVAVFAISRRFWWWYWGIGRMVDALEDIAASLRTFPTVRQYDAQGRRGSRRVA